MRLKKTNGEELDLKIEDSKQANDIWLLKFEGYDTPESLTHFVNGDVMIPESERLPAPEGEYYIDDLEGFRVHTEDGRDIGEVLSVEELPTVNAFNIRFDDAFQSEFSSKSILAPWIDDCVLDIDVHRVRRGLPEGALPRGPFHGSAPGQGGLARWSSTASPFSPRCSPP